MENENIITNIMKDFNTKRNIKKIHSYNTIKRKEKNYDNAFYRISFSNSTPSNLLLTQKNISLNDIKKIKRNIKKNINDDNNTLLHKY